MKVAVFRIKCVERLSINIMNAAVKIMFSIVLCIFIFDYFYDLEIMTSLSTKSGWPIKCLASSICSEVGKQKKHTSYIILIPLNPTFI